VKYRYSLKRLYKAGEDMKRHKMAQRRQEKCLRKQLMAKIICGDGMRRMKNAEEGNKCKDNAHSYVVDRICHEYGVRFTSTFLRR
jgi:hypothetical protein